MLTRIFTSLILILFTLFQANCRNMDDMLEKNLLSAIGGEEFITDQGYIHFDSLGNILVEFNNTIFKKNPLFTELSYIGVWVFPRGANVNLNCCTGSAAVCGEASRSCLKGVGFSQDLGFLGSRYIFREPPQPFNVNADKYYMSVKVSDNAGIPTDYQGDYNSFSGPTSPVGDRELFDLYIGIYNNLFEGGTGRKRPINVKAEIGTQTYYSRVAPDIISPKVEIESRFFATSRDDKPGSWYQIPHVNIWQPSPPLDTELDKRGNIRINEVGNQIGGTVSNDFIELYNPTDLEISLDDIYLQRYTSTTCTTLESASQKEDLTGLSIPAKGFITLARNGSNLPNIDRFFKSSGGITIWNDDCIALTKGTSRISSPYDKRVIDFLGMADSNGTNQYRGSPSISLFNDSAISRCPDGADSADNGLDFYEELATPGTENQCSYQPQANHITTALSGEILISEILHSVNTGLGFEGGVAPNCTNNDDNFVELYNASTKSFNLGGARLYYITSGGNVSTYHTFPSFVLNPGEYLAVVSQDAGCYTSASLSGRNAMFRSSSFMLSGSGATVVLTSDSNTLPNQTVSGGLQPGTANVLDYIGWDSIAYTYQTARSPNCNSNGIRRKNNSQNTNNNLNDFECGTVNGTPGRGE